MELLSLVLVFSIYIFLKNRKNIQLFFLSTSLSIFIIYAIAHYTVNSEGYTVLKAILFNHFTPLYLIAGPSFYFFIKASITDNFKPKKRDLIHLMPFIIQIIGISEYTLIPWSEKISIVQDFYLNPEMQSQINVNLFFKSETNYIIRFIHLTGYIAVSTLLLRKEEKNKKTKKLTRITFIIFSLLVLYYLHVFLILSDGVFNTVFVKVIIYTDLILLFLLILELAKSPELYIDSKKIRKSYLADSPYLKNSNSIAVSEEDKIILKLRIENIKKDTDFFINSENNFRSFATRINYPDHIIRRYLGSEKTSYVDIKNKVRLLKAKEILNENNRSFSLDYVAEKSGFKSRSNFFTIFKKYERVTPTEFHTKKNS